MKRLNGRRRHAWLVALLATTAAAVLAGGASIGHAATNFKITLEPLIGTSAVNEIPQVSYGGKIGYHLYIQNQDTSNTQHASVRITSNLATFSDSDDPSCAVNPNNSHEMVCTPFGGTFSPGAIFQVDLRFTAPTTGPDTGVQVSTNASITISAQTQKNGNKNNGTTIATCLPADGCPVLTNIVENTTKADTYLHVNENAATGNLSINHPQRFSVQTPATLIGNPFGVALSIHDNVGTPICLGCLSSFTTLTIPTAPFVATPGNPFYDGFTFNPYGWTMSAQYSSGFKLNGIVHIDDNNVQQEVPSCASIGGAPTTTDPLCWDHLTQVSNKKIVQGDGRGIENGLIGFH